MDLILYIYLDLRNTKLNTLNVFMKVSAMSSEACPTRKKTTTQTTGESNIINMFGFNVVF